MQADIAVSGKIITGDVYFIEGGLTPTGTLSGDGYFLALKFSDIDETATSVKVGLNPSAGSGLVEIIDDPDKNGIFKLYDPSIQKLEIVVTSDGHKRTDYYDLSGLKKVKTEA